MNYVCPICALSLLLKSTAETYFLNKHYHFSPILVHSLSSISPYSPLICHHSQCFLGLHLHRPTSTFWSAINQLQTTQLFFHLYAINAQAFSFFNFTACALRIKLGWLIAWRKFGWIGMYWQKSYSHSCHLPCSSTSSGMTGKMNKHATACQEISHQGLVFSVFFFWTGKIIAFSSNV